MRDESDIEQLEVEYRLFALHYLDQGKQKHGYEDAVATVPPRMKESQLVVQDLVYQVANIGSQ